MTIEPTDLMPGPCVICGTTNYNLSMRGPTICPSCDCGDFGYTKVKRQRAEIERLTDKVEQQEEALRRIDDWSRAYPLTIFPEPDLKRASELLKAGGMTLDAISATVMRHVIEGVGGIARAALAPKP